MTERSRPLPDELLRSVVRQSKYVGVALAIAGGVITHDYRFVLALAIGSTVDIVSLAWILEHGQLATDGANVGKAVAGVTAVRLLVKSLLILGAAALGGGALVWGMILGVLVVEITLMTVGLVDSVRRTIW